KRFTEIPMLSALSSPIRSALSRQEARKENGTTSRKINPSTRILLQLDLVKEPNVQKTNCCRASAEATYCIIPIRALKVNTRAIPNKTRLSDPAPIKPDKDCNSNTAPKAKRNALTTIIHSASTPGLLTPKIIA